MNILFVDDEKIIREGMAAIIDWHCIGCERLVMAENGSRALEIMETETFDLVITDIYMQKMSGIELARKIKARWPNVKVIILSAYEDFSYAREAIEAGVFKYLLKPIVPEEMEAAITEAMEQVNWDQQIRNQVMESEKIVTIYRPQLARDFWKALIRREISNGERLQKRLQLAGIVLPEGPLCCLVLTIENGQEDVMFKPAERTILEMLGTCVGYTVLDHNLTVAILTAVPGERQLLYLLNQLGGRTGRSIRGVCGRLVTNPLDLHLSVTDAVESLKSAADKNQDLDTLIAASLRLIDENLSNENFGVNDVTQALHVSAGYFSRIFKKKMEITCIEYLTGKRIDKAKDLLIHTNMKHEAIAGAVGYANVHYFSIQFKKHTGETPGQYRKRADAGKE